MHHPHLTEFGELVADLAAERGITSPRALARLLRRNGHSYEASYVASYLFGENVGESDDAFARALAFSLGLEGEELDAFARAFLLGLCRYPV